ncbi:hypothetical protein K0817_016685 [Microbacterium sp. HD4P20]|uniref:hypothetical protein n=1 Tax=Microbacterium sp. HD4P20 TaxID=2864874 RepID=UPI001C63EFB9|nr:hypothetical protein [Microbacterium sp. HD4P20]MCP2638192.1 hypothetical protein [Microbacterium sp. HD4P20]
MTHEPDDELRALRERAYGRHADIHDDPAALARLRELEARVRSDAGSDEGAEAARGPDAATRAAALAPGGPDPITLRASAADEGAPAAPGLATPMPAPARTATLAPAPDSAHPGATAPAVVAADAAPPSAEDPAPVRPWWRRRMRVVLAGSLAAALLLGVGLTLAVQELTRGAVAVLREDTDMEWPSDVWGPRTDGARGFDPFYGLAVISQPQQMGPEADLMECLSVFSGRGDGLFYAGGACGTGPFPATAIAIVGPQSPQELRDRFADGTLLQFVLEGDRVSVFAAAPEPNPDDGDGSRAG